MPTANNHPAALIERITDILSRDKICSYDASDVLKSIDENTGASIFRSASKYPGFKLAEAEGRWVSTPREVAAGLKVEQDKIVLRLRDFHIKIPKLGSFSATARNPLAKALSIRHLSSEVLLIDWRCFLFGTLPCNITKKYIIAALCGLPIENTKFFSRIERAPLVIWGDIDAPKNARIKPMSQNDNAPDKDLEIIRSKIHVLPNRPPFMLDQDVARFYEVSTKRLNQQANRNSDKFPERFRFRLDPDEVAKCNRKYEGGHLPWAYLYPQRVQYAGHRTQNTRS